MIQFLIACPLFFLQYATCKTTNPLSFYKYLEAFSLIKDDQSIRQAAKEVDIPYNTLRDHLNGQYRLYDKNFGPDWLLDSSQEMSLVS